MTLTLHPYHDETDFWRIRRFLREVFLYNNCLERSWHVARLDYWRWHLILNCRLCTSVEGVTSLWETENGKIVAVLNPVGAGEIRLHVHPHFRTSQLEDEMLAHAEEHLSTRDDQGRRIIYTPVDDDDTMRQETLAQRGYAQQEGKSHKWHRDLDVSLPAVSPPPGFIIRSMGDLDEHPARSYASWQAFHAEEPDGKYDGDWSWYQNIQSAPLYRRDLDIVAATPLGEIAAFCTIFYDDDTRSAVCVLVGTAIAYWRRGLGKAVMTEGMQRLKRLGCTRVFATAYDPPADALYRSVMQTCQVAETWLKGGVKHG